jgi:Cthe_2314-like HEPN
LDIDALRQHAFVRVVLDDAMAVHTETGIDPLSEIDDDPPMDERQFYITRVGFGLAHTLTWVEQLHHAIHFLNDFGYSRKVRESGVNRSHHLIYNVENYLVRLQSVYDHCLQLTNNVFHICMSDELVNHGLIVSNLRVARTKVPKLLKVVRKTIEPKAAARNAIVHKHSYLDPELRRIEALYMHTEVTWSAGTPRMPYKNLVYVRSQRMKAATAAKRTEFELINSNLLAALDPLFGELITQYELQKARLS